MDNANILGVIISNSLQWVSHITSVIKKAKKRLYFLTLLKRAKVPLVIFSASTVHASGLCWNIAPQSFIMLFLCTLVKSLNVFKSVHFPLYCQNVPTPIALYHIISVLLRTGARNYVRSSSRQ